MKDGKHLKLSAVLMLLYVVLAFAALFKVLLSPGTIGFSLDWCIPPYPSQILQIFDTIQWIWSEQNFGGEVYFTGYWGYIPLILLAKAGVGGELISKGFILTMLAMSGFGMYFFCRSIGLDAFPSFLGGFFYMFTTIVFNRIAAGHLYHLSGYALMPLTIAFFIKALNARDKISRSKKIIMCGVFYGLAASQLQFIAIIFIVLASYTLVFIVTTVSFRNFFRCLLVLFLTTAICISFYLPWFLAKIMNLTQMLTTGAMAFSSKDWLFWQFANINFLTAFKLTLKLPFFDHYLRTGIGLVWYAVAFFIPVMVFSTLMVFRRGKLDKHIFCWVILGLAFIFLSKGTSPPLGVATWMWIFENMRPIVAFIGEIENLLYIPAMAYAVLIGALINSILPRIEQQLHAIHSQVTLTEFKSLTGSSTLFVQRLRGVLSQLQRYGQHPRIYAVALLIILIFSYAYPSFVIYSESLQTYVLENSYKEIYDKFSLEEEPSRVLWVPSIGEYGASLPGLKLGGLDPMIAYPPKPSFPQFLSGGIYGAWGPYHRGVRAYTTFITTTLYQERTKYLGYLLGFSSIKNILLRGDAVNVVLPENYVAKNILLKQNDIQLSEERGNITLFENLHYVPMVYSVPPEEVALIVGGFSSLVTLSYVTYEAKAIPEQKLVIFSSQLLPKEMKFVNETTQNIIVSTDELYDLMFAYLPQIYRIYPGDYSEYVNIDYSRGWKIAYWPTEWNVIAEPNKPAITLARGAMLNVSVTAQTHADYEVWAKILFGSDSNSLSFNIDDKELSKVTTKYGGSEGFRWVNLGRVQLEEGLHNFRIISGGGKEAVALLVVSPLDVISKAKSALENFLIGKNVATFFELEKPLQMSCWAPVSIGTEASNGLALKSTGNGFAEYKVFIPYQGDYVAYFRLQSSDRSDLHVKFIPEETSGEAKSIQASLRLLPTDSFLWHNVTLRNLHKGWYSICINSTKYGTLADIMVLKPLKFEKTFGYSNTKSQEDIYFQATKMNPSCYEIHVKTASPLFIVQSQNYNGFWKMTDESGSELSSIVANAFERAYYLNATGSHTLKLYYTKQEVFEVGWYLTMVFCVTLAIASSWLCSSKARIKVRYKKRNSIG